MTVCFEPIKSKESCVSIKYFSNSKYSYDYQN